MLSHRRANLLLGSFALLLAFAFLTMPQVSLGQRGGNNNDGSGEDDDFDDAGFDDSGYNQPAQRDTESSNQSPNNYNPSDVEDLDEDDDVDESNVSPQVANGDEETTNEQPQQPEVDPSQAQHQFNEQQQQQQAPNGNSQQQQQGMPFLDNVQTQNFYAPHQAMLVANLHPSEAAMAPITHYDPAAHVRYRRSLEGSIKKPEGDIEDENKTPEETQKLIRRKRYAKKHNYIGPVYTYVKTDKHANFKWGVKHKVGKHYG